MNKLFLLVFTFAVAVPSVEAGSGGQAEDTRDFAVKFEMKNRPSVSVGNWLNADFKMKIQADLRAFSDGIDADEGLFNMRRLRSGFEGRIKDDLEFEVEYELRPVDHWLRDAFVNFRRFRKFQIKAGKFKIPFGLDQLTSAMNLDFVYRSLIGRQLASARDVGVTLHGQVFEGLRYEAGVFNHDGENADSQRITPTGRRTLAGRITGSPAAFIPAPSWLKELEVGAAFTHGEAVEGATSLKGRSVVGKDFFPPVNVSGLRQRRGVELNWQLGPLSLKSEYMTVREQRKGQGLLQNDLPDLFGRGWYAGGTLALFDRLKDSSRVGLLRRLLPGETAGRLELAARYEQLRFGSEASDARPSRSPRAANVLGNSDRALTLGATWYANRFTKFQFNAIRETLEDPARTPVPGVQRYWMFVGRTQFSF